MVNHALRFISGRYQGAEFPLPDEGEVLIGRSGELDLVLSEDMVSRKHAKIVASGAELSITDLGSTNGTFVNGEKVRRGDLSVNDRVLIGTSIVKVIRGDQMTYDGPTDRESLLAMLENLASEAPENATMSGNLEDVPLPDLLQLLSTNRRSGILTLTGNNRGKVYMREGNLEFAMVGGEVSMPPFKAFCRMLTWSNGEFHLEPYETEVNFPETMQGTTEGILMEGLRQQDELARLLPELPPPDASLSLCIPMTPKLSDLETGELDTLQLVLNFPTVKTVIDKFGGSDHAAATNLHKLLREGYLEVE